MFAKERSDSVSRYDRLEDWFVDFFNENNPWQAHDHAIKCLAMDPHEEFFVTGSADGDIKVSRRF